MSTQSQVERWGIFELALPGYSDGNPFTDYEIKGTFQNEHEKVNCDGFYDGEGVYRIRFMPSFVGEYSYRISGSFSEQTFTGVFTVTEPRKGNHGPVHTVHTYHFAYADGTPYYSIGTTCYVWHLQTDEQIQKTLETLRKSAFNKIRFCIFPKHYAYNFGEPRSYPYEGMPMDSGVLTTENFEQYFFKKEGNHFDYTRFRPEYFRHIEDCIFELQKLGIEADLIVMHPYDRWGFGCMTKEQDDLYWKYVVARFSAFRNVWWSLANEYDLLPDKQEADWERLAEILMEKDPYGHLRSIHNCKEFYDYRRSWITHCSIQRIDLYRTAENVNEWREKYGKPVVLDEIAYEGNLKYGWGNITGEEMLRRFWECACRGGYPGHSETFLPGEDGMIWWSHGGELHGESHKRFQLLLDIMKQTPGIGLKPYEKCEWDEVCAVPEETLPGAVPEYCLYYSSFMQPSSHDFYFDDRTEFSVRVIDTWNMTIEDRGVYRGKFTINLPSRQYMAIQITKCGMEEE
ncbi:MAG: DUF5605 domain-containing protein [Clostridiales bacterium]|nr:DUF5605 domain-containing protein [Clostridiales bacterium]